MALIEIRTRRPAGARPASLLLLAVAVSACGWGGPSQAPPDAGLRTDRDDFCASAVDLDGVVNDGPDLEEPPGPPEAVAAAFEEFEARLEPPLQVVEQTASRAIELDVATIARQARYAVTAGVETPLGTPEFETAQARLRAFMISECGFGRVRVTSRDYRFEGVPPTFPAGPAAFTLYNEGAEAHELDVYRIDDEVALPVQQLAVLPVEQRRAVLLTVGELGADPGGTDTEFINLIPGRYAAVCQLPQGSTPAATGTGPPHAALGEVAEFTVE